MTRETKDEVKKKQISAQVSEETWQQFQAAIYREKGVYEGNVGPSVDEALQMFIDSCGEEDTSTEGSGGPSEDQGPKKKNSVKQTNTNEPETYSRVKQERADRVWEHLGHMLKISPKEMDRAIIQELGGSDYQLREYREMFKNQRRIYEMPHNSTYYTDVSEFAIAFEAIVKSDADLGMDDYTDMLDEYDRYHEHDDWFLIALGEEYLREHEDELQYNRIVDRSHSSEYLERVDSTVPPPHQEAVVISDD